MDTKDMWKYFQVEPGNPEDIHVLGVDFGAGELSVAEGIFQYQRLDLNMLYMNNAGDKWDYTAYMRLDTRDNEIIGKEVMQREGDAYLKIYTNFKRPPEKALEKYTKKLSSSHSFTYKELMGRTFYCLVKKLFESNEELCRKNRTVLFVGRPASGIWEEQSKEYQEILKSGLKKLEEEYDQTIDVIVYSEAEAAMAYEYYEGHIQKDETVAIIDGGCSTFDCVILKEGRVINEYSRQVGAGMIEKNMLDLFLLGEEATQLLVDQRKGLHEEKIRRIDYTEGIHTLRLRKRKEEYYGETGQNKDKDLVYSVIVDGERVRRLIDDRFMEAAVKEIPVRIERSFLSDDEFGGGRTTDYPGFYQAVEAFAMGAKARCFDKKTGEKAAIDRIILTGGATVMPFIQEIIQRVFQVEQVNIAMDLSPRSRHFSVAKGLAYMGYAELTMYQEQKEIKREIHEKFEAIRPDIYDKIQETCQEAVWKEIYVDQMDKWTEDTKMDTLRQWLSMPYSCPAFDVSQGVRQVLDQGKIVEEMNALLGKKFRQLFPNSAQDYHFKVEQDDIVKAFRGNMEALNINLTNVLGTIQNLKNILGRLPFFSIRCIGWDTRLTYEEKVKIRDGIRKNKQKTMHSLALDMEGKTGVIKENIYHLILENLDKTLKGYMEDLAPYFVRRYQDAENA